MASHCMHCHKGTEIGHMVSHAKNRLKRTFKPNLQKLKVLKNGISIRVVFCASCIKRLKKDGQIGNFFLKKYVALEAAVTKSLPKAPKKEKMEKVELKKEKPTKKEKKEEEKPRATLDIASIVGKKA